MVPKNLDRWVGQGRQRAARRGCQAPREAHIFAYMGESQYLSVIRIWAAVAWADGVIADAEAAAMKRLIESADLTDDERDTALSWLEEKVSLDTANIEGLSEEARHGIYRAAVRLAAVDLEIAADERDFLATLRSGLNISEDDAKDLEKGVPAMASSDE